MQLHVIVHQYFPHSLALRFYIKLQKKINFSSESFAYVAQIRFLKNGYNSVIIYFL